jgi:helicase
MSRDLCGVDFLSIEDLDLPSGVKEVLSRRGIRSFNPVQSEAISKGLLEGARLLLASPTGSGKTLVAELGMISSLKREGGKAVYVTPLRALTHEKYRTFKDWEVLGFKVSMTSGDYDSEDAWLRNYDIVVTTYEKLDSLWRHGSRWLKDVNYFVLDEIHYISDQERGPVIEGVAVRAKKKTVLALSATISNYQRVADWLSATPIITNWRPVPLKQGVIYQQSRKWKVLMEDGSEFSLEGSDPIIGYALRTIEKGGQVLVFRNSRRMAEQTAARIAEAMGETEEGKEVAEEVQGVEEGSTWEKSSLSTLTRRGVAYHHAGLSRELREVIERNFLERRIKVIVSTPTLAAGVNLPARVVIVGDIHRFNRRIVGYQEEISIMEYKQMSGRAGRPGFDRVGEALIVVRASRSSAERIAAKYLKSQPEPIESRLSSERAFYSFLLSTLAVEGPSDLKKLRELIGETLMGEDFPGSLLEESVNWLRSNGFLREGDPPSLTDFGRKVSDLYLNPLTAKVVREGLSSLSEPCNLAYLHLLAYTPDAPLVGVSREEEIQLYGEVDCELAIPEPEEEYERSLYSSALKIALIVSDWVNEVDEDTILSAFGIGSGDLRSIVETMDWLSYSAHHIAKVLGMEVHSERLRILNLRVKNGVSEELLDLVRIQDIGRKRARVLYHNGIRSVEDVVSNPAKVKSLLGEKVGEKVVQNAAAVIARLP